MQLPNKLYSYENSTLALIPKVLKKLQYGSKLVKDLYNDLKPSLDDPTDFLSVMDCLYALRAVDINEKGEVYKCL
jgi:hypothetical protein